MRAFTIITVTILFHLGSSIIYSFPLNDASLETHWDNMSIQDLQLSFRNKNDNTMKTISKINEMFVDILKACIFFHVFIPLAYKNSELPTKDIDLGTRNLWVLENQDAGYYMKLYTNLNCQLKSICKYRVNGLKIRTFFRLGTPLQTNGNTTRAYLSIPIDIIVRESPNGAINAIGNYNYHKQLHPYNESEAQSLQIDNNKLNSFIIPLKLKIIEMFEKIFSMLSESYHDIEIYNNWSETASNFQQTNLYIIPNPNAINTTDNIHLLPQCIVGNVKKDIGGITNSNFIVITQGLSNFSSAEIEANYTVNKYQWKTELKIENPLRGKFLWEFSSNKNSNNYSVNVDFTIDHLSIKTEMNLQSAKFDSQANVDVGKLRFKTSVRDVIENEEKFSQCIRSIIAKSVSNSSKESIKFPLF